MDAWKGSLMIPGYADIHDQVRVREQVAESCLMLPLLESRHDGTLSASRTHAPGRAASEVTQRLMQENFLMQAAQQRGETERKSACLRTQPRCKMSASQRMEHIPHAPKASDAGSTLPPQMVPS